MKYGKKLKWLIKNKGFSQKDIALKLDIPESTLSNWITKDNPDIESIEAVCRALKVPLSHFFSDPDKDSLIEVTDQERELLKAFREFSDDRRVKVLRIVKELGEF